MEPIVATPMNQTILLVDDESDNIVLMEQTLQRKLKDYGAVSIAEEVDE